MEKPNPADGWEKNLRRLSGWACVAFAARCAQRVLPLLSSSDKGSASWNLSPNRAQQVQYIISLVLSAAETGGDAIAGGTDQFTASNTVIHSIRNEWTHFGKANKIEHSSVDFYSFAAAHQSMEVAYAAVETIKRFLRRDPHYVAHAASAATFSQSASAAGEQAKTRQRISNTADREFLFAGQAGEALIRAQMWRDYEILLNFPDEDKSKKTRIRFDQLGALWDKVKPSWFVTEMQASDETAPDMALEVYVEPGNATKETIQRVFEAISKLHIASGGGGLEFRPDGDFISVRERVTT
jgi:hypothetical protein